MALVYGLSQSNIGKEWHVHLGRGIGPHDQAIANGSLVKALGLLNNFKVDVLYHYHMFVVMNFDNKLSSLMILATN